MVLVDPQVACRFDRECDASVVGDLGEHVVEESDSRGDAPCAGASVEVERERDLRLGRAAREGDAAFAAADELGDPLPRRGDQCAGRFGAGFAQRTAARFLVGGEQDAPRPEIACQQHVGRPVADDVTGREVVASVEIAAEHPRAGFARGGVVGFEGAVDELVVEADAFAFERREHPFVGGPEGRFGERRRAQPVLVGGQYQFEIQSRQRAQPRDGARYEAEFFEAVDLPVDGRFDDQRAVAVDEECFFHGRKVLTVRSRRSFSAGVPTVRRRHPSHPAARERLRTMMPASINAS